MCSRFALTSTPDEVRRLFDYIDRPNFPPRADIYPSEPIALVVRRDGRRRFMLARWGFVASWMKDEAGKRPMINARIETAVEKPMFRGAMRYRRCLVPANAFYEWSGATRGRKTKHRIAPEGDGPIALAAIFDTWMASDGSESDGAAILTRAANEDVAAVHDRMPVIVPPRLFGAWLDTEAVRPEDAVAMLPAVPPGYLHLDPPVPSGSIDARSPPAGPSQSQMSLFPDDGD